MSKAKLFAVAVYLPSSSLAFHAVPNCNVKFRLRPNPISTSACSSFDRHDRLPWRPEVSHQRPRAQVLATPQLEGEAKDHLSWVDGVELDSQGKVQVKGLFLSETESLMESLGEKPDRAEVLFAWLYHDGRLIRDVDESAASNDRGNRDRWRPLGKKTREKLRAVATVDGGLSLEDVQLAADGTRKLVSVLTSGEGRGKKVETVIIPMLRGPRKQPRYTVCVSSQVGCAMNCQFCYTGRLGLMANLQTAQIVEQVLTAKRFLESVGNPVPVTGVVFMGMGEPFDNYERVMRAVKILTDPRGGVRLKGSSVTVSTVGLVPEIERFCTDPDNRASLAVSLHTVSGTVRDQIIPVNRRYPLDRLSETLRMHFSRPPARDGADARFQGQSPDRFQQRSPDRFGEWSVEQSGERRDRPLLSQSRHQRPRRKPRILAVEYTLLEGVNDSLDDAERLADWLEGMNCVVNLITFNPHAGTPFRSSSLETSKTFREALLEKGLLYTVRDSRGDDGMAACGQLGGESMSLSQGRKPVPVVWTQPRSAIPPVESTR